eukprot:COSAG01_NODE_5706_length_4085_cov_17.625690_4_plen_669_part_01
MMIEWERIELSMTHGYKEHFQAPAWHTEMMTAAMPDAGGSAARRRRLQAAAASGLPELVFGTSLQAGPVNVDKWTGHLAGHMPAPRSGSYGAPTALRCADPRAENDGQSGECTYDCETLKRHYYPEETAATWVHGTCLSDACPSTFPAPALLRRLYGYALTPRGCLPILPGVQPSNTSHACWIYNTTAQAWPADLMSRKCTRLDSATIVPPVNPDTALVHFAVGAGRVCTNVTISIYDASGASLGTEVQCVLGGYHTINHTTSGPHSLEVAGYVSVNNTGAVRNTTIVVGECTNLLVRVHTTSVSAGAAVTFSVDDAGHNGPWSFTASSAELLGGAFEYSSCMFDNNFTLTKQVSSSDGWVGTVSVVEWVPDNTIYVPNNAKWIIQGATDLRRKADGSLEAGGYGVPVYFDNGDGSGARLSSGTPNAISNASIVLRHLRLAGQYGTMDIYPESRRFSQLPHSRLGCAIFYEGGRGSTLVFETVVWDHNGAFSGSGAALLISGRAEDDPDPVNCTQGCGMTVEFRGCLFWQNSAFIVGTIRAVNINPVTWLMQDTNFIDNDAQYTADYGVGNYPNVQNKRGLFNQTALRMNHIRDQDRCLSEAVRNPFTGSYWCRYDAQAPHSQVSFCAPFQFGGQTSVEGETHTSIKLEDIVVKGWVVGYHPSIIVYAQ